MNKCPLQTGICGMFCLGVCDPDTTHELHKEAIQAKEAERTVQVQGILDIRLNGEDLATIDPNTGLITNLPSTLDFGQFEYLHKLLQVIKPTPTAC